MEIGALMVLFVIAMVLIGNTIASFYSYRTYGISGTDRSELSWPAQQILKKYHALPEANRPYTNVVPMLKALDVKNGGKKKIDAHFRHSGPDYSYWGWCNCYNCNFGEYKPMVKALNEINEALAEQQRKIEIAGVAGGLEEATRFMEELRREKKIITETTKELT